MDDARAQLKQTLLQSEQARVDLLNTVKGYLERQGINTDEASLKELGFKELDVKDGRKFIRDSVESTVVVTIVM